MRNILRNFWITLTRFKMVSVLNLIGLSIAFATFTIIMMQVRWEYAYGRSDSAADNIYRFDELDKASGKFSTTQDMDFNRAFAESSPLIVESAGMLYSRRNFKVMSQDAQNPFFNDVETIFTNDNIFKIFDINLLKGTVGEFMMPNKAIVSESVAKKFFGDKDPIGQVIKNDWRDEIQICGVYKELPSNATISNGVIIFEEFRNFRMNTLYVKISDNSKVDQIITDFSKIDKQIGRTNPSKVVYRLINVGDVYFDKGSRPNSFIKQGNKTTTDILFFAGILVVVIAMINFVNFYMALAPMRVKGLNARLVFGASRGLLRVRLVSEAIGISIIAFAVSLLWIDIFNSTSLSSVMKMSSLEFLSNWQTILICGFFAVLTGAIAGLFPAKYCTSFEPVLALKGGAVSTKGGKRLRVTLVGFQYVISMVLIVLLCLLGCNTRRWLMRHWDVVVNQATIDLFGAEIGQLFKNVKQAGKILGVTGDFVSKSIALNQDPVAFVVAKNASQVLIRTQKSNQWESLEKLNAIVKEIEIENTPQVDFYSEHIAKLYDNEKQFGLLISLFSIVAIIISLVGVFGIVAFETQVRRKEIGLRKVFGSTIFQVLEMLNYQFLYIVAVSFVIATPISYFGLNKWLSGFAYKTPIYWWVFLLAGITVGIVTVVTVTVQSYRSATENPVKSIKTE